MATATAQELLRDLEACGTAQNRKVYRRHGVHGAQFGVSYANLGKLRKKVKKNHAAAVELWASGNHDARVLATMVADCNKMSFKDLETWAGELDNYVLTDAFSKLVYASAHAEDIVRAWVGIGAEWKGQVAWSVVAMLAGRGSEMSDDYFTPYLEVIERHIHECSNRERHSMNMALIAIGLRGGALESRAFRVADRIGEVSVDHGKTGCTTPDAASYMRRAIARTSAGKQKRRAMQAC